MREAGLLLLFLVSNFSDDRVRHCSRVWAVRLVPLACFLYLLEFVDLLVEVSDGALPVLRALRQSVGGARVGLARLAVQALAVEAEEGGDGGNTSLGVHGRTLPRLSTEVCRCKHLFSL